MQGLESKRSIPENYLQQVKDYIEENKGILENSPTDYERMTLGLLAAGYDPTKDVGKDMNLIEKIYNAKLTKINSLVFGLIALDANDYKVSDNANWTREKIIDAILANQCTNEGTDFAKHFAGEPEFDGKAGWAYDDSVADPDMTGMAMTALAPYKNQREDVKKAIDNAAKYLSFAQKDDGGYFSWGTSNSESCVQVIMGLCTNGIDPTSTEFTKKGKNVVDALLNFQTKNGAFAHKIEADNTKEDNLMATEQGLYGLTQYMYFMEKDGTNCSIYDFINNPVPQKNK